MPMDPLYKPRSDRAVGSFSLEVFPERQVTWQGAGFDCSWVGLLRKSSDNDPSAFERHARVEAVFSGHAGRGYGAWLLIPNMRICPSTENLCKVQ